MIELFYYRSPNARKILIALEELDLAYTIRYIDIAKGDQFDPEYLKINPANKIPAIVDRSDTLAAPVVMFESAAILIYLAEKCGKLLPTDPQGRSATLSWLVWQAAQQGPALGNAAHFVSHHQDVDDSYPKERFVREAVRIYSILDLQLKNQEYLTGKFSIADIAAYPWCRVAKGHGIDITDFKNVQRWLSTLSERPAFRVKPNIDTEKNRSNRYTDALERDVLFGNKQLERFDDQNINTGNTNTGT